MSHHHPEVFEDGIDLQIGLLEAVIPASRDEWPGYPFPHLQITDAQEMRTFRTIVLENALIRVTLLPGMGGRVVSLFDKRTGTEILKRHPSLDPQAGGRRGAYVREGIQLVLDGQERLNALGNVSTFIEPEAEEEGADATVWIGETVTGSGLSFHLKVSVPADRAEVLLEATVLNRRLCPESYNGGLSAYLGHGSLEGCGFYSSERNAGLAVVSDAIPFDGVRLSGDCLDYLRFADQAELAPRQVDRWAVRLIPLSGLGGFSATSRHGAFFLNGDTLFVQTTEQRLGHKILLLADNGQTLEAPVDLYPENVLDLSVEGLNPKSIVLVDPAKDELLRLDRDAAGDEASRPTQFGNKIEGPLLDLSEADLRRWTFDVASRHIAHTMLGTKALAAKRFEDAVADFEQALSYNAEDPLLWWAKALAMRLAEEDNQAELLNAHYLAPLEPALRAEGFLSQPLTLDAEPNRLLEPLTENPEEFIEVACLLIECGQFDQASRWIDEALRHRDMPMLRILMAYCLLSATHMDAEAFDQVRKATLAPLQPPFPYRDVEIRALRRLLEAFPGNDRLGHLMTLLSPP